MKREKTRHLVFVCFFSLSLVRLCYCRRCVASLRAYTFTNWNRLANVGHTPKPEPPSSLFLFSSLSLSLSVSPIPKKVDKNGMKKRGEMKTTTTTIPSSSFQTLPFFFLLFASLYILLYGNLSLLDDLLRRGVHLLFFLLFAWLANFSLSLSLSDVFPTLLTSFFFTEHLGSLIFFYFCQAHFMGGTKFCPPKKNVTLSPPTSIRSTLSNGTLPCAASILRGVPQ